MVDPNALKHIWSRTVAGMLALTLALAWCAPASAAQEIFGGEGDEGAPAAEEAPEKTGGDDAAPDAEEPAAPADDDDAPAPGGKAKKRVGNIDPAEAAIAAEAQRAAEAAMPADDAVADAGERPGELIEDADKSGDAGPPGSATAEEPGAPGKPAPKKTKEKKGKDYVKKRDQKRNDKGLYQFESVAYIITTDVSKDLANVIAAHMDRVYLEYSERLAGFRPNPYAAVKPNQKMPLYVIKRYRDYLTIMQGFGHNVANSGGVFFRNRDGSSGLATWVEGQSRFKMFNVLQHEGFHQFADARIMLELPPWVNEGLAEYFGDAVMVKGKLDVGRLDSERLERMKRGIKQEVVLPFRELMTMDNEQWVARVVGGDQRASLMYDNVWSICYFLIHGGKRERAALEQYLLKLNNDFVTDPTRDRRNEAFVNVFGSNLAGFEKAWRKGVLSLEPDTWYTSLRHVQTIAAALKQFHARKVEVRSWGQLKEQMVRHNIQARIRERDIVARGVREEKVDHVEEDFNFPNPAQVELRLSTDPKLPHGMLITHIKPNILLSWTINEDGVLEEDISYVDPPRGQIPKTTTKSKKSAPVAKKPADPKPAAKARSAK